MQARTDSDEIRALGDDVVAKAKAVDRMRQREMSLDRCRPMLLAEHPPREHRSRESDAGELDAGGAIVQSFITAEQQRVERCAEAQWTSPVVRDTESLVGTDAER